MKVKTYFLRSLLLLALLVPWITQGQVAKVSEYDGSVTTAAYGSIVGTSGATAWGQTTGYVDVSMNFAMPFGEQTVAQNSTLRVYGDGRAEFVDLPGSMLAPLYYDDGYTTTATSVYTKSIGSTGMVVEWRKVTAGNNSLSFQLMLYSSGDIEFHYGPMTINEGITVFAGLKSSDNDVFSTRGEDSPDDWGTLGRTTTYATRTLSSASRPAFNSNQGVVYTFTQPACVKPTTATATVTAYNAIQVDWTVSSTGTKYEVRYSDVEGFDPDGSVYYSKMVTDPSATSTTLTDNIHGNTTYYIYVRSYCGNTPSGWKDAGTVTTPQSCPSPSSSSFTLSNAGVASWSLTSYPNISSIDIYYSTDNIAPDDNTTPSMANIAVSTENVDLAAETAIAATSKTMWYVWFRGNCTVDGGNTLDWTSSAMSFTTPCGLISVTRANPYMEDFENYAATSDYSSAGAGVPDCWILKPGLTEYTRAPHVGTKGAIHGQGLVMTAGTSNCPTENFGILPEFSQNLSQLQISFNYKMESASSGTLYLGYVTDVDNPSSSFVSLVTIPGSSSATSYEYSFAGNTIPENARITFRWYHTSSYYYVNIDDVVVGLLPTCSNPTDITGNNPITWTAGTATQWQVRWAEQGSTDYTSAIVTEPTYTSSAWASNTDYTIQIRSICGEGDTNDWVSYNFTTPCNAIAVTSDAPFSENFESGTFPPQCWTMYDVNNDNDKWTIGSGINGTSAQLYTYYNTANNDWLITPALQFATDAQVTFKVRNYNATTSEQDEIAVWISNDDFTGLTLPSSTTDPLPGFTRLFQTTIPVGDAQTYTVPMTGYTGTRYIAFVRKEAPADGWYLNLDDIVIKLIPTCFKPTDVAATPTASSAELSWTENGTATQWEVRYWKAGAVADAISVFTNDNPYTLNYLDMATSYSFQVRGICSVGDTAEWSDVSTFYTPCPDFVVGSDLQIGSGSESQQKLPTNPYYNYALSEQIFTADEMGGATTLTSVSFDVSTSGSTTRTVDIYLAETDKEVFSDSYDWVPVTDMVKVVSGGQMDCSSTGWKTIVFDVPFNYSGTNNLIVVFDDNTGSYKTIYFNATNVGTSKSICVYSDGTNYNPLSPSSYSGTVQQLRSNIKNDYPQRGDEL